MTSALPAASENNKSQIQVTLGWLYIKGHKLKYN